MIPPAPAVRSHRRRRLSLPRSSFLPRPLVTLFASLPLVLAATAPSVAAPQCADLSKGWCVARRFSGDIPQGELGFRFGEPLDSDGDDRADVAAGARFKLKDNLLQNGVATVWSGATGEKIREWDGVLRNGLFGHSVVPIPDLDGDRLADVVISAPNSNPDGTLRGVVSARSPKSGELIWRKIADREENLGWDLALAGDQNGDQTVDVFAGAPAGDQGHVYLLNGKDGSVLRTYAAAGVSSSFGWYVAKTDDLDADGHADLVVGAFQEEEPDGCGVYLLSAASGALLHRWSTPDRLTGFGEVVAAIGDLDGDGHGEIAVASPRTSDDTRSLPGEVQIFSGSDWKELRHWTGKQPGELYGRMVYSADDVDGDGVDDVAIGAPWYRSGEADKTGRAELRSGKTGEVLAEWLGDEADCWFGWHIRRAPDPDGKGRPALLISSLRHPVDGKRGVGVLDLYVLKR